jgi:hypothetical protein
LHQSLTSVTIPNSVTSIAAGTFGLCTNLASITIGNSVTSIEGGELLSEGAFYGCTSLTSVNIPNSVTSIGGRGAFYGCTSLASVTIGNSASIGAEAFAGCTRLTSITIPDSVTSIGSEAFKGTAWLNNQPDGLVYAGKVALIYKGTMPANTSINLSGGTKGIANVAFSSCANLAGITIPNSVTTIGIMAFSGCTSLASVTIPNSVTRIGNYAFSKCSKLTSVTFEGTISSSNLSSYSFDGDGDLRAKFYATDKTNGTPGTYTRPNGTSNRWTKQ